MGTTPRDSWLNEPNGPLPRKTKTIRRNPDGSWPKVMINTKLHILKSVRTGARTAILNENGKVKVGTSTYRIRDRRIVPDMPSFRMDAEDFAKEADMVEALRRGPFGEPLRKTEIFEFVKYFREFSYVIWPIVMGMFAFSFAIGSFSNPPLIVLAAMFSMLAWKGNKIGKWLDAKEAAFKERRIAKKRDTPKAILDARIEAGKQKALAEIGVKDGHQDDPKGFTLIEVLVVVAIIVALVVGIAKIVVASHFIMKYW